MENKVQKTKQCKKCKEEINVAAKKCPHCGSKQGIPKWVIAIIVFFVLVAVVSSGGESDSSKSTSGNGKNTTSPDKTEKFSYEIDKSYVGDYGIGYYIEGSVKNNKDKDYSYVQIEFICYDAEGNNLGTAVDNTNNLLANQTWKYKAMFLGTDEEKVDHCDYHEVTGY
ncbi:MAG: hypothetical protein E7160_02360 [Firmicutes bacterium]|nr:hypothetical protein [Bacillota bacterium]